MIYDCSGLSEQLIRSSINVNSTILLTPEQRAFLHAADMTSVEKKPEVNIRSRISISHNDSCRFSRSRGKKAETVPADQFGCFKNLIVIFFKCLKTLFNKKMLPRKSVKSAKNSAGQNMAAPCLCAILEPDIGNLEVFIEKTSVHFNFHFYSSLFIWSGKIRI